MKKIAWITDSTCGLSAEYITCKNIYVLPLNVIVDGMSYKEDVDLTRDEFYEKLRIHGEGAKTSQPAFGEFIELYSRLKGEYDCGFALHASSALTGTYQSSVEAGRQTGFSIKAIDSGIGAYSLGKMIMRGIEMEESGAAYEEIASELDALPAKAEMYLLPESLNQLKRSGRVTTTQMIFASLLNIFLILGFEEGKVVVKEKVRTDRKAEKRFFEMIDHAIAEHGLEEVGIMHAGAEERARAWKEKLESIHRSVQFKVDPLVPVAGVHTGFGTMAAGWLRK